MKTVGQTLKEARESKDVTIKQVSNAIKIRESLIEALENGNYYAFSSDMHLKSFLRSYASYLRLSEEMIMALYRRDRQIEVPDEKGRIHTISSINKNPFVISKYITIRLFLSILGLICLTGIFYFFFQQWKAFNTPPTLEILSPKQNEVLTTDNFVIEGFTGDPSVKVLLDGNEANYTNPNGSFKVNGKFSEPGLKRFQLIAQNQFNKTTEVSLDLMYKPQEVIRKQKVQIKNKTVNIYSISVTKDTEEKAEVINIGGNAAIDIVFEQQLKVSEFDKSKLDLFLNDQTSPSTSVNSSLFTIKVENGTIVLTNEIPPTPSPSIRVTATPSRIPPR